eukprot:TRINITY_DN32744_c1_g1_i1.p1 TRINITY_DN32744_c1_g1~~TRINITY_DN32744_c1_g1_i1.p1  ORF type:complete len:678 (-),score=80.65 TRINITY_DN32744_c1_g1_i1:36-2012(-)
MPEKAGAAVTASREDLVAALREVVDTSVTDCLHRALEAVIARVELAVAEMHRTNKKLELNIDKSLALSTSSLASRAISDPGASAHAEQFRRKAGLRKRHTKPQSIDQLKDMLFDEILTSTPVAKITPAVPDPARRAETDPVHVVRKPCREGRQPSSKKAESSREDSIEEENQSGAAGGDPKLLAQERIAGDGRDQRSDEVAMSGIENSALPGPPPSQHVEKTHPKSKTVRLMPLDLSNDVDDPNIQEHEERFEQILPHAPANEPPQLIPITVSNQDLTASKPVGLVRSEVEEAIVSKIESAHERAEEERIPIINAFFGQAHLLRYALIMMAMGYLALRVCVEMSMSGSLQSMRYLIILRDVPLLLYAILSVVSSYAMKGARGIHGQMLKWASLQTIVGRWNARSRKAHSRSWMCWAVSLVFVLLSEVLLLVMHVKSIMDTEGDSTLAFFFSGEIMSFLIFILANYLLMLTTSLHCHLLTGADLFLDRWCGQLSLDSDTVFEDAIVSWNSVQALIRRVGNCIDSSFSVVQTFAFLGCGLITVRAVSFGLNPYWSWEVAIEISNGLLLALLVFVAGLFFFQCAAITEKCTILPSLVNQITPSDTHAVLDYGRYYLVRYLTDSGCGIYVKGVRLNMGILLKLVYTLGMAVFASVGLMMRLH